MMLEGKYQFDILDIHSDFDKYKVIILPDHVRIDGEMKVKLDAYVANGGKLLATGSSALYFDRDEFAYDLGARYEGKSEYNPSYIRPEFDYENVEGSPYVIYTDGHSVACTGKSHAKSEKPYFNRTVEHFCSHKHAPSSNEYLGGGVTEGECGVYIAWDIFSEYATVGSLISKRVVEYALDMLLGDRKSLKTNLKAQGIASLMHQVSEHRYVSHLLYASPVTRGKNTQIIEDILPVYDTTLELRLDKDVKKVYLAPQMKELDFEREGDKIKTKIDRFECHQMVVFEY
jgi:hypothetical protein